MKRSVSCLVVMLVALAVFTTGWTVHAQTAVSGVPPSSTKGGELEAIRAAGKPQLTPQELAAAALTVNNQTAVMCNLCFTCGGDWPIFAGSIHLTTASTGSERGGSCSGILTNQNDFTPFLCCR